MGFWIGLVIFCLTCILAERLLPKPMNKMIPYVLLFVLCFFSAFRYMIGWDYESYITLFYNVDTDFIFIEQSFNILCMFFRENNFDYQIIFIIYSFLTFYFIYRGIKNYARNQDKISLFFVLALTIFFLDLQLLWNSFSIIRQALAVSIYFFGVKYIIKNDLKKFVIIILLATFFHYSAILLLPTYYLFRIRFSKYQYIILICLILMASIFDFVPNMLMYFENYLGGYSKYIIDKSSVGFATGITKFFYMGICLVFIFTKDLKIKQNGIFLNIYVCFIFFLFNCDFSAPIYRFKIYFEMFYIILGAQIICESKSKWIYFLLFLQCMMFIKGISGIPTNPEAVLHHYKSANNIEYQFNFNILK